MKKYICILIAVIGWSCSSSKDVIIEPKYSDFKIVNTPVVVENDTIYVNELRFYEMESATDAKKLMRQNYGKWSEKLSGLHHQIIKRIVWQDVKLIDGNDKTFTVVTDGTESMYDYFTCLIVFDSEKKDCFKDGHPYKEELIKLFTDKMDKIK